MFRSTDKVAAFVIATALFAASSFARAQAASATAPGPDVLTLANGDHLTGKFISEANGVLTFDSDGAGELTLKWEKIKSIETAQKFAVIRQGQRLSRKQAGADVAQGAITTNDGKVQVTPASAAMQEIPQADAQYMVEQGAFTRTVQSNPSWGHGWTGALSAGVADVEATQNSRTFTGAANFVRTVPSVSWLDPRNRTTANFAAAYGSLSQPGAATTKTNILHADLEHDWFLSPRLYALADAAFDHNYSQGLSLQQLYGGGLGVVAYKTPVQELDLKGEIHYERQHFGFTPGIVPPVKTPDQDLIGASIGDTYAAKLAYGILFNQGLLVTPSFNVAKAYSAIATAGLTFPVYKRLGFNLSALDDFLNDPAFGSKKNSFQFSAGITYTLK